MKKYTVGLMLLLSTLAVNASPEADRDAISKRIAPVGQVYVAGATPVAAVASGPRSGQQVYQAACFACHGTGALDAPKPGDVVAWEPRIAQGFDVMLQKSIAGFNNMPAMGACANCSDDEIAEAIRFMTDGA